MSKEARGIERRPATLVLECRARGSGLHPEGGEDLLGVRENPDRVWFQDSSLAVWLSGQM